MYKIMQFYSENSKLYNETNNTEKYLQILQTISRINFLSIVSTKNVFVFICFVSEEKLVSVDCTLIFIHLFVTYFQRGRKQKKINLQYLT